MKTFPPLFVILLACLPAFAASDDDAVFFTPPGFSKVGEPRTASGPDAATLKISVIDKATGKPTACRVNVVGPDGNYYQPPAGPLTKYSMTGEWPKDGAWGNRPDKAPYRYLGRFFYCSGETSVAVPIGKVRVEVFKGLEYRPVSMSLEASVGDPVTVRIEIERVSPIAQHGYFAGDLHLHFARESEESDGRLFDLLDAEDVWFGTPLAYNEPAGPYQGVMSDMDSPQWLGLGRDSLRARGHLQMLSGQEYRSAYFGHLNLYRLPRLVFESQSFNLDDGPAYGAVGAEAMAKGGYAIHAHGGYAKEIYADAALGTVNAVELLQFGIYRELGLNGWYDMLNTGYRFPCVGASDFPACRFMSDCRTYARPSSASQAETGDSKVSTPSSTAVPDFDVWLKAVSDGRSFVTTGPLLLFEIDGHHPGDIITRQLVENRPMTAKLKVRCEVTPVTNIELIVNGEVAKQFSIPADKSRGQWFEVEHTLMPTVSSWIAARAYSKAANGQPDAEAHTNPIYLDIDGKRCYRQKSLDAWVNKIDGQIAIHTDRNFKEKAAVLAYFQRARDALLKVRAQSGLRTEDVPWLMVAGGAETSPPQSSKTEGPKQAGARKSADLEARIGRPDVTDEELKEFLRPVPPRPAEECVKDIEVLEGFRVDLVAAEPLVHDPVAACFDEDGQLYVCEMRDYPFKPRDGETPVGSVRLLRDVDGDGRFDEGHLFADKLLWAAGIVPWKGGVFVAAAPDIWYLKDTDGDFRADIRRRIFTGFGTGNQQAMVNNLQYGFDHWIYGTTAGNGGTITKVDDPSFLPISVTGRDFRFDPVTEKFETITGTVQFGNTFDDWGNRFTCSESQPLSHIVQPDHYLVRNPFLAAPTGIVNIAPGPIPIFRISPVERWRQIRSLRRISKNERPATSPGASHHVVDAAAGVTIYRGGAYPPEFRGQVFVGDGQNNLVHRRALKPNGLTFQSSRVDEKTEFMRSPDIWFRPVNFVNAPDGTLYCLDMCREVLESIHIPLDVARHLNFASGRDHGRIYRIAPSDFKVPPPVKLSSVPVGELVRHLESPHGWWRDTAQRLIYERQEPVAPELRRIVADSRLPQAKVHAMWALAGLKALDEQTLGRALQDPHPRVREHAVRLSEPHLKGNRQITDQVIVLAADSDIHIRYQVAFSLGESTDPRAATTLLELARRDGADPWMRTAILSSSAPFAGLMFQKLDQEPGDYSAFLQSLAGLIGSSNDQKQITAALDQLAMSATKPGPGIHTSLLQIGRGLRRAGHALEVSSQGAGGIWLNEQVQTARAIARDDGKPAPERTLAIELLGVCSYTGRHEDLLALISTNLPEAVQIAAIEALSEDKETSIAADILAKWNSLAPTVRSAALEFLWRRDQRLKMLLEAAAAGELSLAELDPIRRQSLREHRDSAIRSLAEKVFRGVTSQTRETVLKEYQAALRLNGDTARGEMVFMKNCSACHRLGGKGHVVGPDLASSANKEPQALLTHILDPNQYVLPNYLQYLVIDTDGRNHTGVLAGQTASSIILKKDQGATVTVLRNDIEEITSTGKSLMPEELEKAISVHQMADLLAYLQQSTAKSEDSIAERDFGTLPGLIEPSAQP